jgi:hypothetical protein
LVRRLRKDEFHVRGLTEASPLLRYIFARRPRAATLPINLADGTNR